MRPSNGREWLAGNSSGGCGEGLQGRRARDGEGAASPSACPSGAQKSRHRMGPRTFLARGACSSRVSLPRVLLDVAGHRVQAKELPPAPGRTRRRVWRVPGAAQRAVGCVSLRRSRASTTFISPGGWVPGAHVLAGLVPPPPRPLSWPCEQPPPPHVPPWSPSMHVCVLIAPSPRDPVRWGQDPPTTQFILMASVRSFPDPARWEVLRSGLPLVTLGDTVQLSHAGSPTSSSLGVR